jgi:hypothetical protein
MYITERQSRIWKVVKICAGTTLEFSDNSALHWQLLPNYSYIAGPLLCFGRHYPRQRQASSLTWLHQAELIGRLRITECVTSQFHCTSG